jgi:Tol biopolymer transport system component
MRKFVNFIALAIFLSACASNTPQSNSVSEADQVATIVAATLTAYPPTEIPATPTPPMDGFSINGQLQGTLAFIRNNNMWININGVENQLTSDADPSNTGLPKLWYSNPQISPDGTKIAFLKMTGTDARMLMVSDIDGKNIRQLVNDVEWTLPTTEWSNDSQKIYYPVSNGFDTATGFETIAVKSINPITGEVQDYGQFGVRAGCGGGSSDPADSVASSENMRPFGGIVFELSPQNNYIVHTVSCSGSGLGVLDLSTKQDRALDDHARAAVISPDGSRIAAISDNNIVVINSNNGNIESTFPISESPQAVLWNADGKGVLYSTSRLAKTLTLDDKVALDLFGSSPASYNLNISTLWMVSLESGQSTKIIESEAHDLKPIFTNGQRVLVVMVENAKKLFDYVAQGNRESLAEYYPTTNILEADLTNSSSNPITSNTKQASFHK